MVSNLGPLLLDFADTYDNTRTISLHLTLTKEKDAKGVGIEVFMRQ